MGTGVGVKLCGDRGVKLYGDRGWGKREREKIRFRSGSQVQPPSAISITAVVYRSSCYLCLW